MQRATVVGMAQFVGDALLGLAVFFLVFGFVMSDGGARAAPGTSPDAAIYAASPAADIAKAVAASVPDETAKGTRLALAGPGPAGAMRSTSESAAVTTLAIVFSLLFSLNLGFWRHVRRTYSGQPGLPRV